MKRFLQRLSVSAFVLLMLSGMFLYRTDIGRGLWYPLLLQVTSKASVENRIDQYGASARARLKRHCDAAGVAYPPAGLTLLGLKEERRLELWVPRGDASVLLHSYPILAASGHAGPKLREGDRQVPEGIYRIVGLNPKSSYHLSMKLNYPNAFDRMHAEREGRTQPGSDIFIHGKSVSVGCLAMGDAAIEELFVLVHDLGLPSVTVVIAPYDGRTRPLIPPDGAPVWTGELYTEITRQLPRES